MPNKMNNNSINFNDDNRERVYLFDTILRDGQQTQGIDFSYDDKILISHMLDELGIDYIEGGFPGANPTDTKFFSRQNNLRSSKLTAFGMTKRIGVSADNDPHLNELLQSNSPTICVFGKTWDLHVEVALEAELDENLEAISETIKKIEKNNFEPLFDCEHFFDGFKNNKEYAIECARTAYDSGARWVVLCDTNGGTMPSEVAEIVAEINKYIPPENLGIHAHNDCELAVANSLAALDAGVRHIQGTMNGLGERCGNANLTSIIPSLILKPYYNRRFKTNITEGQLKGLTQTVHAIDELLNRSPAKNAPYTGQSAFAHKGGIHASAVMKLAKTYEHIDPELVGNERSLPVSDQSGKSNIIAELKRKGIEVEPSNPKLSTLISILKDNEDQGYAYEGADASFELLARKTLFNGVPSYFDITHFRTLIEHRFNSLGQLVTISEATIKFKLGDEELLTVGEGNGPVNALDTALRAKLVNYYKVLEELELVDYKVRILNGGTEATTRVLIESSDNKGNRWSTVGVSPNIVDASFQALSDSIIYMLVNNNIKPV